MENLAKKERICNAWCRRNSNLRPTHPDDEALACSGIIMQALSKGKRVRVVVFTNGDGFRRAAAQLFRKPIPVLNSSDMLELGRFRQAEGLAAMAVLGLQPTNVTFLGYPDRGLNRVYRSEGKTPYKQKMTQKTETYGLHQPDYHFLAYGKPAAYRKASCLADVTEIIQRVKPDQIYVPTMQTHIQTIRRHFGLCEMPLRLPGITANFIPMLFMRGHSGHGRCP